MKCELLEGCVFFNTKEIKDRSDIIESLKATYCLDNPLLCARRRVAVTIGREKVPENLQPDQIHRVQPLIEEEILNQAIG
jgi:hypothetical protein